MLDKVKYVLLTRELLLRKRSNFIMTGVQETFTAEKIEELRKILILVIFQN